MLETVGKREPLALLVGMQIYTVKLRRQSVCLQCGRPGFDSWVGKIPWRRKWQPIPALLPGKIPWTEEPDRLQSMGSQRVRHD